MRLLFAVCCLLFASAVLGGCAVGTSYPDWGRAAPVATVAPLADLGELAARLGSIHTYDRRGNVVWIEDFEGNLAAWTTAPSGSGSSLAVSTDSSRSGKQSAKFVTGNVTDDETQLSGLRAVQVLGKIGLEAHFTGPGTNERWYFDLRHYDGDELISGSAYITGDTAVVTITNGVGATVDIALPYPLFVHTKSFHAIKIVADFNTRKWVRLVLDSFSADISAYSLAVTTSTTRPSFNALATLRTLANANKTQYLDDIIITQNEP